jgi:PAS domain S-box-containing protein
MATAVRRVIYGPNMRPAESLAEVFEAFNESTLNLQRAYDALQRKFGALNRKLEDTNRELNSKVTEITEIKEYLNSILHSATNGVIAINLRGEITAFNKAAERITGLEGHKVLNRPFNEVFETEFGADFENIPDDGQGCRYISRDMRVRGGFQIPVRESTSVTRDASGRITGAVKVFEDLSELRELEEQARRQDRLAALGQMAATVAHEIRNPLGGIEGFASLLARDFDQNDPRAKLVTKIQEGARSLNRVVNELLMFTRPMKLDFQKIEIEGILDGVLSLVAEDVKNSNIKLHRKVAQEPLFVWGDAEQLKRALLNITINAIQAMPQGGRLHIGCRERSFSNAAKDMLAHNRNGTWVEITVRDTGPGIPESDIPRIFSPFYTTKEKGTGLGLAIASKIVEGHRGQITVSNSPKGGAVFVVSLPL